MNDPKVIAEAVGAAALLKSDIGKKLITPLAENLGLAVGDLGDIYRFYQTEILGKIFTKWAEARNQKPLTEEEIKRVFPLLRLASEQTDENLHERWAALLEHTATSKDGVLPSFGQTLSQLSSEEAKFMDRLFVSLTKPRPDNWYTGLERSVTREVLIQEYDPTIDGAMSRRDLEILGDKAPTEQLERRARLDHAYLLIHDLERLGIIQHEVISKPDSFAEFPRRINGNPVNSPLAGAKIPIHKSTNPPKPRYSFTPYGLSFARAVRFETSGEVGE